LAAREGREGCLRTLDVVCAGWLAAREGREGCLRTVDVVWAWDLLTLLVRSLVSVEGLRLSMGAFMPVRLGERDGGPPPGFNFAAEEAV
jgi:hypothetical protein